MTSYDVNIIHCALKDRSIAATIHKIMVTCRSRLAEPKFISFNQAKNLVQMITVIDIVLQDLWKHERFVLHTVIEGVHKHEPIKRIAYVADNDRIISGSASSKTSVVIIDRKGNKKPYVFKLTKVTFTLMLC